MRPIVEILKNIRDAYREYPVRGLCTKADNLVVDKTHPNHLMGVERDAFFEYLHKNRPDTILTKTHGGRLDLYYWYPDDIESRLEWLDEYIEKLSS